MAGKKSSNKTSETRPSFQVLDECQMCKGTGNIKHPNLVRLEYMQLKNMQIPGDWKTTPKTSPCCACEGEGVAVRKLPWSEVRAWIDERVQQVLREMADEGKSKGKNDAGERADSNR